MTATRYLTEEEKLKALGKVKLVGDWQAPPERQPFGHPAVPWEDQLDLDEFRTNQGMEIKILPVAPAAINSPKTQSICNSIMNRLRKLNPKESWTATPRGNGIYLRFNGTKRVNQRRNGKATAREAETQEGDALFAETG